MQNLVVYCGSKRGAGAGVYVEAAQALGRLLVEANIGLVYGGGRVGLMGVVAETVMKEGGRVTGVITEQLNIKEIGNTDLTELVVVRTMHERKQKMADLADGAIVMPGGFGTLDEAFEFLTWNQINIHTKPCGFLNTQGYFDHLFAFLNHAVRDQFIHLDHVEMIISHPYPNILISSMKDWIPKHKNFMEYDLR